MEQLNVPQQVGVRFEFIVVPQLIGAVQHCVSLLDMHSRQTLFLQLLRRTVMLFPKRGEKQESTKEVGILRESLDGLWKRLTWSIQNGLIAHEICTVRF